MYKISNKMQINGRTTKKYSEKWGEIVVYWLEEDLVGMGFKGSYRTLCNFIQEWKVTEEIEADKGHERLNHPEGEVQLDFSVMEAVKNGEIIDVHALVVSFPVRYQCQVKT